jgi:hypothetical protein
VDLSKEGYSDNFVFVSEEEEEEPEDVTVDDIVDEMAKDGGGGGGCSGMTECGRIKEVVFFPINGLVFDDTPEAIRGPK